MTTPPPRIPRTAKGERPQNFSDPAIDTLLGVVISLVAELSVTRDRLETVERLLERSGVLSREAVEGYEISPAEKAERAVRRQEYLERVLRAVRAEFEGLESGRVARPVEAIIADLAQRKF
jgi:uncharacterized protein YnzC (UPF0291/DUF896 family)